MIFQARKIVALAVLSAGLIQVTAYAAENSQVSQSTMEQTLAVKNQTASTAFLNKNKKKAGVVTLVDGLQYKIVSQGSGATPTDQDTVKVDYVGTTIDGKEFDSSYKTGQPASFQVGAVIPGWTEALKLMKVGSTWEVFIPSQLAYGEQGVPPAIGPNQALIFKIKLLEVQK